MRALSAGGWSPSSSAAPWNLAWFSAEKKSWVTASVISRAASSRSMAGGYPRKHFVARLDGCDIRIVDLTQ